MRETRSGVRLDDGPILLTGAGGFVGSHMMTELGMGEGDAAVDARSGYPVPDGVSRIVWDLPSACPGLPGGFRYVVHMAAISSVSRSFRDAGRVWEVNLLGTLSVLEYVVDRCPGARLLFVGTSDAYGSCDGVITEDTPVAPGNPYAASKAAAEIAVLQTARSSGIDAVVTRTFPHFGPGQDASFALPSFCRRIVSARREGAGTIVTGNLEPVRDYLYVTDVTRAYAALLAHAVGSGVYNVCSGRGRTMREMLDVLLSLSGAELEAVPDDGLFRTADVSRQVGSPDRLRAATGWECEVPLEEGLGKLLEWWEDRA